MDGREPEMTPKIAPPPMEYVNKFVDDMNRNRKLCAEPCKASGGKHHWEFQLGLGFLGYDQCRDCGAHRTEHSDPSPY